MKKVWKGLFGILAMAAMITLVSCEKETEEDEPTGPTGIYIKGAGTAITEITDEGKLTPTKNEVNQETRGSLREIYIAVQAGPDGFNLIDVVKGEETSWGPGADFAQVPEAELDAEEPGEGLWKGSYVESTTPFTVPEDGLYHVVLDTELGMMAIAKVEWGLIGAATPGGWSTDTEMTSTFDLNTMEFSVEDVTMSADIYKLRYSGGWKIILDENFDAGGVTGIKVNCNFGGAIDNLEAGGGDMEITERAQYKATMTWSLTDGYSATMEKTGEAEEEPEYPENLYMIGGSVGGWDWAADGIQMVPVHSNPNAFWRIVWIESGVADPGIKFAPGQEWVGDFGVADDTRPAAGDHQIGSSNVPDVAETGYYMVWIDLDRDSLSITQPEVYLIGATLGDVWDTPNPDAIFTVDNENEKLTITRDLSAGELRMYAWHKWHYDWWQHEFMILNGMIEYRGKGGDQERVSIDAGTTTIDLNFKTGEGTITQ